MSNIIKLGNLDISAFKVGAADCSIYLGTVKVYSQDSPTPPTDYKAKLTYSGGTTYTVECDGNNTTLTSGETRPEGYTYSAITSAVIGNCTTNVGTNVGNEAITPFSECTNLNSVTILDSVDTIGYYAFGRCSSLSSLTIPDSVTTIANVAFWGCSGLTSANIGNGVTSIGEWAFEQCSSLTSVTIGSGITSIGTAAFDSCSSLSSVTILATTPPTITWGTFDNSISAIYVPAESVSAYQSAGGAWMMYTSKIQAIPSN